ncbi:hypothetical protein BDV96DRAFT_571267 [Lophiotrema nucula]|uniref:Uncharacterized protein n=1 Tax=Lophiotrema nucula TaxID=690887 RepID=A0A6A5ZFY5_9PLEO|nr:hypothetical protein BDV96DRAFT_571267 [Lophiotrema nucula]
MADFQILVRNKSGTRRQYFLFVETPTVTSGAQVFQNVYATAAPVPDQTGTAKFVLKKDYFAVTGTSPGQKLGSGVNVSTTDFEIAKIAQGPKLGSTVYMTAGTNPPGKGAEFVDGLLEQKTSTPGSFTISTDGSFQLSNGANQFIGLGGQDPYDPSNIIPIATFEAEPNTTSIITPKSKYYVSWGTFTPGQIIDVTTIATVSLAQVGKITRNSQYASLLRSTSPARLPLWPRCSTTTMALGLPPSTRVLESVRRMWWCLSVAVDFVVS